ncbi:MAG: hypothetical protein V7765_13450 [Oleispira sp.]
MSPFHRLIVLSLLSWTALAQEPQESQSPSIAVLKNSQAHYVRECKRFLAQELYEPALFSCYSAYQLGSTDMGAVLYRLGKHNFFDELTSNNLRQEYKAHKGSPEIQRLLLNIKFSSQNNYIAQGSIYGSWCLDKDMNLDAEGGSYEGRSFDGYARLVINPTGHYINAAAKIEKGTYQYSNNILSLGYPNYSEYQVSLIDKNQLILKTKRLKTQSMEKPQENDKSYSRKSCSKLGMQRFIQELVSYKSTTSCDEISHYLGHQLIPAQYLPKVILNKLKQDPKRYHCPQLIKKVSEAYESREPSNLPVKETFAQQQ